MSDAPSDRSFDRKAYQRPQQDWLCGHHAEGRPCPNGPSGQGECLVEQICTPWHDGTAWHCTRARAWGGRCEQGPIPDPRQPDQMARCPNLPVPCQPQQSLRRMRRRLTALTAAAALGVCLVILGGSSSGSGEAPVDFSGIISPGPLSAHHATMDQGCAACHSAATESPVAWLRHALGAGESRGIEESSKCLECHSDFGAHALFAHSADPSLLARETEEMGLKDPQQHTLRQSLARLIATHVTTDTGELACATCHREHRGADADLSRMTNAQCQACHSSTFHSFADGHPEFSVRKRAFLYFDHVTHFQSHFPSRPGDGSDSPLRSCTDCHVLDSTGGSMVLAPFETACAECHAGQIADDNMPLALRMPGTMFITLNLEEIDSLDEEAGSGGINWPQPTIDPQTYGNRLESLPPFMEALLLADDDARAAIETLRDAGRDGSGVDEEQRATAQRVYATAIRQLINDLAIQGESAVETRFQEVLAVNGATSLDVATMADRLADSGFFSAVQFAQPQWFPDQQASTDTSGNADGGGEVPTLPPERNPLGGAWVVSADGLSLLFRARGHADPLLQAMISFAALTADRYPEVPTPDTQGVFDRLFQQLAAPEATGHCMKCHTVDALESGDLHVNWRSRQTLPANKAFTTFSHEPHVTFLGSEAEAKALGTSSDRRCETCHAVKEVKDAAVVGRKSEFLLPDWMPNPDDTHPSSIGLTTVRIGSCVACHTQQLAGDSCLQCHNYHVHSNSLSER